ncbi:ThiF family adenylyltransferase [Parahaliea mediterranea]|uniref:HesA/MoeB/ThiF family protein n=1 Tax=Parahaliea mediterranea TaxID=651086 RepID=A0A939DIF6_9GAMM|nr:HesA/MoeB/ThiF family protein [Parahaliea mediterranea]
MSGEFSAAEWQRYARQVQLPEFGLAGQRRLREAHVVIVGVGGLGCPAALYLAAAGVGRLTLVDGDRVELSNIHRQVLFGDADRGKPKVAAAAGRLRELNPAVQVEAVDTWLEARHEPLLAAADLVLDCCDRYAVRQLINRLCLRRQRPWCYASVDGFHSQSALFRPGGPCYECLYPQPPAQVRDCRAGGVLGPVAGLAGVHQALAAIAYLAGLHQGGDQLALNSPLQGTARQLALALDPACVCRLPPEQVALPDTPGAPAPAVQADGVKDGEVHADLAALRRAGWHLVDIRSAEEYAAFNLGDPSIPAAGLLAAAARGELPQPLALYCQSGARSRDGAAELRALGLHAISVAGGILGHLERHD